MYVFGGLTPFGPPMNDFFRCNVATGAWNKLAEAPVSSPWSSIAGFIPHTQQVIVQQNIEGANSSTSISLSVYSVAADTWEGPWTGPVAYTTALGTGIDLQTNQ